MTPKKTYTKKINVTNYHIRRGIPGNFCQCPIALAIKGQTRVKHVWVAYEDIECGPFSVPTTKTIQKFIDKFDDQKTVKPFSFVLRGKRN